MVCPSVLRWFDDAYAILLICFHCFYVTMLCRCGRKKCVHVGQGIDVSYLNNHLKVYLLLTFIPRLLFTRRSDMHFVHSDVRVRRRFGRSLFSPFRLPSRGSTPSSVFRPRRSCSLPSFSLGRSLHLPCRAGPSLLFQKSCDADNMLERFPRNVLFNSNKRADMPNVKHFGGTSLKCRRTFGRELALRLNMSTVGVGVVRSAKRTFDASKTLQCRTSSHMTFGIFNSCTVKGACKVSARHCNTAVSLSVSRHFNVRIKMRHCCSTCHNH